MNLGYKYPKQTVESPALVDKDQVMYPSIHFERKVPPELMDKDIGETCRCEVVLKIRSKGMNQYGPESNENLSADVLSLNYLGKAGKKTKEEYLKMSDEDRESYDKEQLESKESDDDQDDEDEDA